MSLDVAITLHVTTSFGRCIIAIFRLLVATEIGKFKGQKLRKRHFMTKLEIKPVSVLVTFARSKTNRSVTKASFKGNPCTCKLKTGAKEKFVPTAINYRKLLKKDFHSMQLTRHWNSL